MTHIIEPSQKLCYFILKDIDPSFHLKTSGLHSIDVLQWQLSASCMKVEVKKRKNGMKNHVIQMSLKAKSDVRGEVCCGDRL